MKAKVGIAIVPIALVAASAGTALAEEKVGQASQGQSVGQAQVVQVQPAPPPPAEMAPSYTRSPMRAPWNAFEIGVNTGYTQGFGDIADGLPVGDVADAGIGVGLDLAYRATPGFSLGFSGQFQEFDPDTRLKTGANARGVTGTIVGSFHLSPYQRVDPVLSLGTGYRMLWAMPRGPNNDVMTHGFQLARLNAALDIRVSDDVALGPMVGADLNLFVWRNPEGSVGNQEIDDKSVNTFIYAGVQGRFDVGGTREAKIRQIGSR